MRNILKGIVVVILALALWDGIKYLWTLLV